MNSMAMGLLAMVGGGLLTSLGWLAVAKVWRYRGDRISDVMLHPGFSDDDKLRYARALLSAAMVATLVFFASAVYVLNPSFDGSS